MRPKRLIVAWAAKFWVFYPRLEPGRDILANLKGAEKVSSLQVSFPDDTTKNYLLPANPLGRGFDPEFGRELVLIQSGDPMIGSVDHDELVNNSKAVVKLPSFAEGEVEYRGWMVTPEQYELLAAEVARRGLTLATSLEQFRVAHHIDGWLNPLQGVTFNTVLLPQSEINEDSILDAATLLGAQKFFIKDYVKSQKGVAGVSVVDGVDNLYLAILKFIAGQGEWFAGGIVIRAFQELPANRTEVRGWWRNGTWMAFTNHPDYSGHETPEIPIGFLQEVTNRLQHLAVAFVTVDFTVDVDGRWWVIEVGDGQVSGFPNDVSEEQMRQILLS